LPIPAESRRRFRSVIRRAGNRFKVGIIWCGSLTFRDSRWRSTTIERFLKPSDVPAVQIYNLHKGPLEQELETSGAFPVVVGLGSHVRDFADRAAVVDELDLVIMPIPPWPTWRAGSAKRCGIASISFPIARTG